MGKVQNTDQTQPQVPAHVPVIQKKMKLALVISIALALVAAAPPVLSEEPVTAVGLKPPRYETVKKEAGLADLADSADSEDSSDASEAVAEFLRGHKKKDRKASKRSSKKKKKKKASCKKSCKKKTKNVDCSRRCSSDYDWDSEDSEDVEFTASE